MSNGKINYKWQFSIDMLVSQRVEYFLIIPLVVTLGNSSLSTILHNKDILTSVNVFLLGKLTNSMAILNSYVELPEAISTISIDCP